MCSPVLEACSGLQDRCFLSSESMLFLSLSHAIFGSLEVLLQKMEQKSSPQRTIQRGTSPVLLLNLGCAACSLTAFLIHITGSDPKNQNNMHMHTNNLSTDTRTMTHNMMTHNNMQRQRHTTQAKTDITQRFMQLKTTHTYSAVEADTKTHDSLS